MHTLASWSNYFDSFPFLQTPEGVIVILSILGVTILTYKTLCKVKKFHDFQTNVRSHTDSKKETQALKLRLKDFEMHLDWALNSKDTNEIAIIRKQIADATNRIDDLERSNKEE